MDDSLSASWQEFYSFYGPKCYEVCAGTAPYQCDVAGPVEVDPFANRTGAAPTGGDPAPRHLEAYAYRFDGLALAHGTRYYVTVTLVDAIGQRAPAASDGVAVDSTAPTGGVVVDGRRSDFEEKDFQYGTKLFVWWDGFADPESGVTSYEAALSTRDDPLQVSADEWQEVYGVAMATFDVVYADGTIVYAHVKAINDAGLHVFATSDGRILDNQPPVSGDVMDGDDAALAEYQSSSAENNWDLRYQSSLDTLVGRWQGFVARTGPNGVYVCVWSRGIEPQYRGGGGFGFGEIRTNEIRNGEIRHNKTVPNFAMVFKNACKK